MTCNLQNMLLPFAFVVAAQAIAINLTSGLVITRSVKVKGTWFNLPGGDEKSDRAVVTVKGNGITVDFNGATMIGTPETTEPDQRKGLAVRVIGKNVTIKNLKARGYKVGLLARDVPGLKILDCDFSYNWKQHLKSTPEKEDESDWMSYHKNDHDEWLLGRSDEGIPGYSGGIYLRGCDNFVVRGTKILGGQCGLMITQCNKGLIWNNNFSFLSGLGLAMYRSSDNRVMHNKIDWCVRGYSHGIYNRGQDSAGILIYEQSNRNLFAYNSVTHGGDGFFLWAGQTTMDTGEGGCNDNLVYGNDFSFAPTNGIEATFSRNKFVNNLVQECWHGVWGGYSFDSLFLGNHFSESEVAIAIEHGQHNTIRANQFSDKVGIQLWQNKSQDPNWGYPKHHDTVSHDYKISANTFLTGNPALSVRDTKDVVFTGNDLYWVKAALKSTGDTSGLRFENNSITAEKSAMGGIDPSTNAWHDSKAQIVSPAWQPSFLRDSRVVSIIQDLHQREMAAFEPAPLKGGFMPAGDMPDMDYPFQFRRRQYIIIDEWGPYDFLSPRVVAKSAEGGMRKYSIFGPKGRWRLVSKRGVGTVSSTSGEMPGSFRLAKNAADLRLEFEYVGSATTDHRGIVTPAGKPVRFSYREFSAPIHWTVKLYKWSKPESSKDHANPDEAGLQEIFHGTPVKSLERDRLDFAGYSFDPSVGNDHYATVAEGSFELPAGDYVLDLTTDDGARLWLDGKPLIQDAWHYQGPTTYSRDVKLTAGRHTIRVEHFQIDGYAALKVGLKPK